jgi:hypothetical protein
MLVAVLLMLLFLLLVVRARGILDRPAFVYVRHATPQVDLDPYPQRHLRWPEIDTPFLTMDDPFNVVKE